MFGKQLALEEIFYKCKPHGMLKDKLCFNKTLQKVVNKKISDFTFFLHCTF